MSRKTVEKSYGLLRKVRMRCSDTFVPENSDKKINEILHGGPPMKKIIDWFKENKSWWSIWILIFIIVGMLSTCSELKVNVEYHYKTSSVVQKIFGNIK